MQGSLTVLQGGMSDPSIDAERLRAAELAVLRGYEQAVAILSPGAGHRWAHADLPWFEAGLADCREIAGLPRLYAHDNRAAEDAYLERATAAARNAYSQFHGGTLEFTEPAR